MRVAIVDYGSGNLRSAQKAFERAAADAGLAAQVQLATSPDEVLNADRVVLPGVGAFGDCMAGIAAIDGMTEALQEVALVKARPFLGICVGMQLMADRGLEHGEHAGFGWISGTVVPIAPGDPALKIPHMGWNVLLPRRAHPVFEGLPLGEDGWHAYFVHSYHFQVADDAHLLAETDYGGPLTAAIARDNLLGFQFHPEKSQRLGLRLIASFLRWNP